MIPSSLYLCPRVKSHIPWSLEQIRTRPSALVPSPLPQCPFVLVDPNCWRVSIGAWNNRRGVASLLGAQSLSRKAVAARGLFKRSNLSLSDTAHPFPCRTLPIFTLGYNPLSVPKSCHPSSHTLPRVLWVCVPVLSAQNIKSPFRPLSPWNSFGLSLPPTRTSAR